MLLVPNWCPRAPAWTAGVLVRAAAFGLLDLFAFGSVGENVGRASEYVLMVMRAIWSLTLLEALF